MMSGRGVLLPEASESKSGGQRKKGRKTKKKGAGADHAPREDDDGVDEVLSGEEEVDGGMDCAPSPQLLADLGVRADSDEEREDGYQAHAWEAARLDLQPGSAGFNK